MTTLITTRPGLPLGPWVQLYSHQTHRLPREMCDRILYQQREALRNNECARMLETMDSLMYSFLLKFKTVMMELNSLDTETSDIEEHEYEGIVLK